MYPALHTRLGILDVLVVEPFLEIYFSHRINRPHKVALVTKRNSGVDAHAALKHGIGGVPFPLPSSHTLGRHEGLSAAAREGIDNVGLGVNPSCQAPHDIVHVVRIGIFTHRNNQPRSLRGRKNGCHEVALPTFLDLVAFFNLDDRSAPISHAVGNVDVHDDAGLHPFAQLEHRSLTHGSVDVVVIESVNTEREDDRLAFTFAGGYSGDVKSRSLIGFAHIAGPFRMEMITALYAGLLGFSGFKTAVSRIDIPFENHFS